MAPPNLQKRQYPIISSYEDSSDIHDNIDGSSLSKCDDNNDSSADLTSNLPSPPTPKRLRRRISTVKSKSDSDFEIGHSRNEDISGSISACSRVSSSNLYSSNVKRTWTLDHCLTASICAVFGIVVIFMCILNQSEKTTEIDPSFITTLVPSLSPSETHSMIPSTTSYQSMYPSSVLSKTPSSQPTPIPSTLISSNPTSTHSLIPTTIPTNTLSLKPSELHSVPPSNMPSISKSPSRQPSNVPTSSPSKSFAWDQIGNTLYGKAGLHDFGKSIAISRYGSHLAVGQQSDSRIDIYFRLDEKWVKSNVSIVCEKDTFQGEAVDIAVNETIRVAGHGANGVRFHGIVQVWDWNADSGWVQIGQTMFGEYGVSFFGKSLALSANGEDLIIGNMLYYPESQNGGEVRVMHYYPDIDKWIQKGDKLNHENLDGSKVVVNRDSVAITNDGKYIAFCTEGKTSVEVFEWKENSKKWMNLGTVGVVNTGGVAVELSNRDDGILVVAVSNIDVELIHVFWWDGLTWSPRGSPLNCKMWQFLGLSENGNTVVSDNSEEVIVFDWDGIKWSRRGEAVYQFDLEGTVKYGRLDISGDGNTVVVGSPLGRGNSSDSTNSEGYVKTFEWQRPK